MTLLGRISNVICIIVLISIPAIVTGYLGSFNCPCLKGFVSLLMISVGLDGIRSLVCVDAVHIRQPNLHNFSN